MTLPTATTTGMTFYFSGVRSSRELNYLKSAQAKTLLIDPCDYRRLADEIPDDMEVILDSSAYRAFRDGRTLSLEDWKAEIAGLPLDRFKYIVAPDIVGDASETMRLWAEATDCSQSELKDLPLMPVWQWGGSRIQLEYFLEESEVVGIGGLIEAMRAKDERMLDRLTALCEEFPGRFHIFGLRWLQAFNAIKRTAYSADSSVWLAGRKYKQLIFTSSTNGHLLRTKAERIKSGLSDDQKCIESARNIQEHLDNIPPMKKTKRKAGQGLTKVNPPTQQPFEAEANIADFLFQLGVTDKDLKGDWYLKIENPPYIPLVIEKQGTLLYFTHWLKWPSDDDPHADLVIDAEMIYKLYGGRLTLQETADRGPIGEIRQEGGDRSFATDFSECLFSNGFIEAHKKASRPRGKDTESRLETKELALEESGQSIVLEGERPTPIDIAGEPPKSYPPHFGIDLHTHYAQDDVRINDSRMPSPIWWAQATMSPQGETQKEGSTWIAIGYDDKDKKIPLGTFNTRRQAREQVIIHHINKLLRDTAIANSPRVMKSLSEAIEFDLSPMGLAELESSIGDDLARRVGAVVMWGKVCGFRDGFGAWALKEFKLIYETYNAITQREIGSETEVKVGLGHNAIVIGNKYASIEFLWDNRDCQFALSESFGLREKDRLLSFADTKTLTEKLFRFPREEGANRSESEQPDFSISDPYFAKPAELSYGQKICAAADDIANLLRKPGKVTTPQIADIMRSHFGAAAEGNWTVKDSHEAGEVALVKRIKAGLWSVESIEAMRAGLRELQDKLPNHTGRTIESEQLQQFSTPLELALLAWLAADIDGSDVVLEPSAGTGMLAACFRVGAKSLILNEISQRRADILKHLFQQDVFTFNAEQINNVLPENLKPTVAVINPPFSASPGIDRRNALSTLRHFKSAMRRVEEGGRIVLISAHWFHPENPEWEKAFTDIQKEATLILSTPLPGQAYQKHGTHMETRISVFDKIPAADPREFRGVFHDFDLDKAFYRVQALPPRQRINAAGEIEEPATEAPVTEAPEETPEVPVELIYATTEFPDAEPVNYSAKPEMAAESVEDLADSIFESYSPQRIVVEGAREHPSKLCESAAMSSVKPPMPTYKPLLPPRLITEGILSEAQLESIIYAGEAHSQYLNGVFMIDSELESAHWSDRNVEAKRFRRGWFLGDGTGTGKGRQVAGIIADNWARGRKKAMWISEKATLIEDARRDWEALGGDPNDIINLNQYPLGTPITIGTGILFCTYATLRSPSREGKKSRLDQILDWLGPDFDGPIAFDESHAMGGAVKADTERGRAAGSLQGKAGIRLQNAVPDARIVYVSATGATRVESLAYASRLGLWGTNDVPFQSRAAFINEISDAGVAAMELISRDLKALGLYLARTLSYEGIEYDPLMVTLNEGQEAIYNTYAEAFEIIHQNIEDALEETNAANNSQSKAAAISAFEGVKLRFFNHLIIGLKTPAMIRAIEKDLEEGRSALVSLVSTNEAIINRRLATVPTDEWNDLTVDITPRDVVIDYVNRSFPVQAFEEYQDGDEIKSRPVVDSKGNPVFDKVAMQMRDELIEKLMFLPPISGALEQILFHFGDEVAEVTGRSVRLLKCPETGRIYVDRRPINKSNLAETQRFMDGEKRILVFSDAGGTGRSYHADLSARNQQQRSVYMAEPGWRADKACQALGRAHRTNQASAPIVHIVACTNIPGEKRFVSTIAKRLFALGALTRGQRQAAGENIFSARDDLESDYAKAALVSFLQLMARNHFPECGVAEFECLTGLELINKNDASINTKGIPITRFMNRLLALKLDMQRILFDYLDRMIEHNIDAAIQTGLYEVGVETLHGKSFKVISEQTLHIHEESGAETHCLGIEKTDEVTYREAEEQYQRCGVDKGWFTMIINDHPSSGNAALMSAASETISPDGERITKLRLVRPKKDEIISGQEYDNSFWRKADSKQEWLDAWNAEIEKAPKETKHQFYLINGLLIPLWGLLSMGKRGNVKVVRLRAEDGETYLGRLLSSTDLDEVAKTLKITVADLDAEEMVNAVLHGNRSYDLPQGLRLKRSRLRGEERLELIGYISHDLSKLLVAHGVLKEIINYQIRHFIPSGSDAQLVLGDVRNTLKGPEVSFGQQKERPDFKAKNGQLHPSVVDVLERSKVLGQALYLPEQLSRELYVAVNDVIDNLGGVWKTAQQYHLFPEEIDLVEMLEEVIESGTLPPKNPLSYFPTPKEVGDEAVKHLDLGSLPSGSKIWEPSCGEGHLLKSLEPYKENGLIIHANEIDQVRAQKSRELGIAEFVREGSCMTYGGRSPMMIRGNEGGFITGVSIPEGYYDRILMNPPFSGRGRRYFYVDHVNKALKMLKNGGILVAILPISILESSSKMVEKLRNTIMENGDIYPLPDGAFKESGTNVKTAIIKIQK